MGAAASVGVDSLAGRFVALAAVLAVSALPVDWAFVSVSPFFELLLPRLAAFLDPPSTEAVEGLAASGSLVGFPVDKAFAGILVRNNQVFGMDTYGNRNSSTHERNTTKHNTVSL
eukprot:GDKK01071079.1.p1 GENE.GDKK01071079.1~~GDKK01071079.1.p1  ORF type:complete len:115 (+),score=6.28 GDKK01071079.1:33-377(+)